jgi:histone H3/H4
MTERDLSLFDRKALRDALLTHAPAGTDLDRSAVTRVAEILEAAAAPGLFNLATLGANHARKHGRKTATHEDIDAALDYIETHGLSKGALHAKGGSR